MITLYSPVHPGEFIKDLFISDELNATNLATHLNVSPSTLNRVLNAKSSVSCEMALRLEKVLGLDAETWLEMQNQYDLFHLKTKLANEIGVLRQIPNMS